MPDLYQPQVIIEVPGKVPGPVVGQKHCPVLHRHVGHTSKVHHLLDHINQRALFSF